MSSFIDEYVFELHSSQTIVITRNACRTNDISLSYQILLSSFSFPSKLLFFLRSQLDIIVDFFVEILQLFILAKVGRTDLVVQSKEFNLRLHSLPGFRAESQNINPGKMYFLSKLIRNNIARCADQYFVIALQLSNMLY